MLQLNEKEIAIVMLGTGCAAPTLLRRLPSTAIVQQGSIYMFDAGEGTQIQFRKHRLRFTRLSTLFITHLHGDHVTGIIGMLMSMELQSRVEPLLIIGPPGIKAFIETTRKMLNTYFSFSITIHETEGETLELNSQHSVDCRPLDHRIFCLGYRLMEKDRPGRFFPEKAKQLGVPEGRLWGQLQAGKNVTTPDGKTVTPGQVMDDSIIGRVVTYCTDTRPCDNAIILAENADILIYEGTFAAGEEKKAHQRGHSSARDAYQIGQKAGVSQIILTHISARYSSMNHLLQDLNRDNKPYISSARDLDVWILPWKGLAFRRN